MRIRQLLCFLVIFASVFGGPSFAEEPASDAAFAAKLNEKLTRTDKSIKLLRDQIVESANAPFLQDLYLQLGDLLAEKANTLYYVQMERQKTVAAPTTGSADKAFSPVVATQKEAIGIYQLILKDFPKTPKRPGVLFRLALSHKSIDEGPAFIKYSSEILKQYPSTDEAMKIRLLIGQHYFDQRDYGVARKHFEELTKIKFPYERNLAKYRLGLISLAQEKFSEALHFFEEVIKDPELKEQDNPYSNSLQNRGKKSDLKREALIDSIRAYTYLYDKDADPATYYSNLAPSEGLFQEVIEKLALRYINLKKYSQAVKLLRVLSERIADPQKVITTYQNVLLLIPVQDRIDIPVEEMHYLLDKFNMWSHYFELAPSIKSQSFQFFEKQVRDLGTTAHDLAKGQKDAKKKRQLLQRARDFYLLYLGSFDQTNNAPKMASNLADVFFLLGDYLRSGDYYLRTFHGEFGQAANEKLLVENALLCFQKKIPSLDFYENIRFNGLFINAIEGYIKVKPAAANDPKILFSKVKAEYDQGFFPESLEHLFEFVKKFPAKSQSVDASELLLDYFNTRNEYGKLYLWSNRLLALNLPNGKFNAKLKQINSVAKAKAIQEKVKAVSGYDEFAQGKSYLAAALSSENGALANETLKQALAKSKAERDVDTFIEVALVMAGKENDFLKKHAILRSVATEQLRMTRFYAASRSFLEIYKNDELREQDRLAAFDQIVNIALLLRDWDVLEKLLGLSAANRLPEDTKSRLRQQFADLLTAPVPVSNGLVEKLLKQGLNDEILLGLFKAHDKVKRSVSSLADREIHTRCGNESKQTFCRWGNLPRIDLETERLKKTLSATPPTVEGIQSSAQEFLKVSTSLQNLEGSGDPFLETAVAMRNYALYTLFAGFLSDAAASNAALKQVLRQKSQETNNSAKLYVDKCRMIGQRSSLIRSDRFCKEGRAPTLSEMFMPEPLQVPAPPKADPEEAQFAELKKQLFASSEPTVALVQLSKAYYDGGHPHHAAATASYGLSLGKGAAGAFKTLLGCSLSKLGLIDEASYHLKKSDSLDGLRDQCLKTLASQRGER